MADSLIYFLNSGPGRPDFNMGMDEGLLLSAVRLNAPTLRFYGWTEPAASFGYFQKYADVEQLTRLRPLVRRPTGGGIVPHDADWTYSLVFPPGHWWYELSALESYRRVHEWIQTAFTRLGVTTGLAAASHKTGPGQCFAGHERFDVLAEQKKIAGAAQRRSRDGLLIQGSIQPKGLPVERHALENAMRAAAPFEPTLHWSNLHSDGALKARAEELARDKYSQREFNQRR